MKVAILGYDVEGRVSYEYFLAQGHEVTIHDLKTEVELPVGVTGILGDVYLDGLDRYDLLVRTAGLAPKKILDRNPGVANKITTHINEFFRVSPTKNIIGVTGTKGKGTTSTLIAKMLEAAGKQVKLGGNIGLPPLTFLSELTADSWVVLELSSFQLIDIQHAPHTAVCLMVVPEHLDWHTDIEEYYAAKANLFTNQAADDIAIYFANNETSKQIAARSPGTKIPYFAEPGAYVDGKNIVIDGQIICKTAELKLLGQHNWQNACAAVTAVWRVIHSVYPLCTTLTTFSGLEHRLELVRELNGVKYYDDSYGTTPETAVVAIQSFAEPKILIVGGSEKGSDYTELVTAIIKNNVEHVICIGITGQKIADMLEERKNERCVTYTVGEKPGDINIDQAVAYAKEHAQPAEIVLLSAASASFDMFKNYKHRGEEFKRAVQALV